MHPHLCGKKGELRPSEEMRSKTTQTRGSLSPPRAARPSGPAHTTSHVEDLAAARPGAAHVSVHSSCQRWSGACCASCRAHCRDQGTLGRKEPQALPGESPSLRRGTQSPRPRPGSQQDSSDLQFRPKNVRQAPEVETPSRGCRP